METFFYNLHKAGAALGAIITLVLLIKLMRGIAQKQSYDTLAQRMMLAFSGLITAEWLIGIAILIARGDFMNVPLWSHAGTMTVAAGISYLPNFWRQSEDLVRYRRSLLVVMAVMVLVAIGIVLIRGKLLGTMAVLVLVVIGIAFLEPIPKPQWEGRHIICCLVR